jgi:hypothetical protein
MPAIDPYASFADKDSFLSVLTITPNDSNDLAYVVRLIYVGTAGDISVIDTKGNTATFKNCPAGTNVGGAPIARVKATGTTASNLVGLV